MKPRWGPGRRLGRRARGAADGASPAADQAAPKGVATDFEGDADVLLVTFASMRPGELPEALENLDADETWPVKRLYARDLAGVGYHLGIVGLGGTIAGAASALGRMIEESGARRVVFLGYGIGAYAALLFGRQLEPDEVHAISPQTTFDYADRRAARDFRGQLEAERIRSVGWADERYLDLRPLFERQEDSGTAFHIHYDDRDRLDRFHAERLEGLPGVRLDPLPAGARGRRGLRRSGALAGLLKRALFPARDPGSVSLPGVDPEPEPRVAEAEVDRLLQGLDVLILVDDRPQAVRRTLASIERRDALRSITIVSALPVTLEAADGVKVVAESPGGYMGTFTALAEHLGRADHGSTLFLEAGVKLEPEFFDEAARRLRRDSIVLFRPATRGEQDTLAEEPPATLRALLTRPYSPTAMLFRNELGARRGGLDPWFSSLSVWEMLIRWYAAGEADVRVSDAPVTEVARGSATRSPGERYANYLAEHGDWTEGEVRAQVAEFAAHRAWLHRAVVQSHLDVFTPLVPGIIARLELALERPR